MFEHSLVGYIAELITWLLKSASIDLDLVVLKASGDHKMDVWYDMIPTARMQPAVVKKFHPGIGVIGQNREIKAQVLANSTSKCDTSPTQSEPILERRPQAA